MNQINPLPPGKLRLVLHRCQDTRQLERAVQRIRWLPGVMSVGAGTGELEVVFSAPASQMVRQIHQALACDRSSGSDNPVGEPARAVGVTPASRSKR